MKKISSIVGFIANLVIINLSMAADGGMGSSPKSITFDITEQKRGKQCIILNRTSPNFERELLSMPREACVIVVGSWIIKTDFLFKPMEIVSPKSESWKITTNEYNPPRLVDKDSWSFKLKTKGIKQVIATINYHF